MPQTGASIVNGMRPINPGEILREAFLISMKLNAHARAMALRLPAPRINEIVRERPGASPEPTFRKVWMPAPQKGCRQG